MKVNIGCGNKKIDGFIGVEPAITTNTYTVVGANADLGSKTYYILTRYGCGGNNLSSSDSLESIVIKIHMRNFNIVFR